MASFEVVMGYFWYIQNNMFSIRITPLIFYFEQQTPNKVQPKDIPKNLADLAGMRQ